MQQVFEGIKNKNGRRITGSQLTKEEKKRRVVLKRVNLDGSVLRSNFLKAGTMARVGWPPPHHLDFRQPCGFLAEVLDVRTMP